MYVFPEGGGMGFLGGVVAQINRSATVTVTVIKSQPNDQISHITKKRGESHCMLMEILEK